MSAAFFVFFLSLSYKTWWSKGSFSGPTTTAATATLSIEFHYTKWIRSHSLADLRGVPEMPPLTGGPNSSIFMQVSTKNLKNNPNLGVGAPPSGKSWIHHWHWCGNGTTSKWVPTLFLQLQQWQTNCFNCYLSHGMNTLTPLQQKSSCRCRTVWMDLKTELILRGTG